MTSRILSGALAASAIALLVGACDGNANGYWHGGHRGDPCAQYTSCGTCTPADGCGWCTTGVNQGMCASDPNECASAPSFSWTWNASGCFAAGPDGGVAVESDAGGPAQSFPPSDAGAGTPVDAGSSSIDGAAPAGDSAAPASDAGEDGD